LWALKKNITITPHEFSQAVDCELLGVTRRWLDLGIYGSAARGSGLGTWNSLRCLTNQGSLIGYLTGKVTPFPKQTTIVNTWHDTFCKKTAQIHLASYTSTNSSLRPFPHQSHPSFFKLKIQILASPQTTISHTRSTDPFALLAIEPSYPLIYPMSLHSKEPQHSLPLSELPTTAKPNHKENHSNSGEVIHDAIIGFADGLTVPFALTAGLSS